MTHDYIPPSFVHCPEEFEKVKLIATRLLKWKMVECFGQNQYWWWQFGVAQIPVNDFNPITSLNDAFLVLNEMRHYGAWTLEFPDRDNVRATFTPYPPESREEKEPRLAKVSFICCSLENAITTVAYRRLVFWNLKEPSAE